MYFIIQCLSSEPKTLDACLRRHDMPYAVPFGLPDGTRILH